MTSKKTRDDVNGKDRSSNVLLAIAAVLVLGLIAYVSMKSTGQPESSNSPAAVRQASVFPTLDPAMFTGRTRDAYQAAKDIPEVLSEVDCYCGCMENSGHQSNLFCFMDQHGVG